MMEIQNLHIPVGFDVHVASKQGGYSMHCEIISVYLFLIRVVTTNIIPGCYLDSLI